MAGKPAITGQESTNLVPLPQLKEKYKDFDGGLYGGGRNQPPEAHAKAAAAAAASIAPLDSEGKPSADGKIVLMSIGMSNTTQEFSRFKQIADVDPEKSTKLVIVDAAQAGKTPPQDQWRQQSRPVQQSCLGRGGSPHQGGRRHAPAGAGGLGQAGVDRPGTTRRVPRSRQGAPGPSRDHPRLDQGAIPTFAWPTSPAESTLATP